MAAGARDEAFDDNYNRYAIIFAAEGGHPDVVTTLVDKASSDVNSRNIFGQTALHLACAQGNIKLTQILLNANAGVDIVDRDGRTALHEAAKGNLPDNIDIVKELLDAGALVNHMDDSGEIPLYEAARSCISNSNTSTDTIRLLLKFESKIKLTNWRGDSVLDGILRKYCTIPDCVLNILYASGCPFKDMNNCTSILLNDFMRERYGHFVQMIKDDNKPMLQLTGLCRRFLRHHLMSPSGGQHCNLLVAVQGLPLPTAIKDYLLYGLINEAERVYNIRALGGF